MWIYIALNMTIPNRGRLQGLRMRPSGRTLGPSVLWDFGGSFENWGGGALFWGFVIKV